MSFCLIGVGLTDSYHASLLLIIVAVMGQSVSNASIPPNAQDIAPNYAGSVFGKFLVLIMMYIQFIPLFILSYFGKRKQVTHRRKYSRILWNIPDHCYSTLF